MCFSLRLFTSHKRAHLSSGVPSSTQPLSFFNRHRRDFLPHRSNILTVILAHCFYKETLLSSSRRAPEGRKARAAASARFDLLQKIRSVRSDLGGTARSSHADKDLACNRGVAGLILGKDRTGSFLIRTLSPQGIFCKITHLTLSFVHRVTQDWPGMRISFGILGILTNCESVMG